MPNSLIRSLRTLFRIKRTEREMDRELRFHLEMETEENIRRGMKPEEARLTALRSFGGVDRFKEECRDVKRNRPLETLWQDARFGARVLGRNPGFTLLTVLTLTNSSCAMSELFIPDARWRKTDNSRSDSRAWGSDSAWPYRSNAMLSASDWLRYRPPPATLRTACTSSSLALSLVR